MTQLTNHDNELDIVDMLAMLKKHAKVFISLMTLFTILAIFAAMFWKNTFMYTQIISVAHFTTLDQDKALEQHPLVNPEAFELIAKDLAFTNKKYQLTSQDVTFDKQLKSTVISKISIRAKKENVKNVRLFIKALLQKVNQQQVLSTSSKLLKDYINSLTTISRLDNSQASAKLGNKQMEFFWLAQSLSQQQLLENRASAQLALDSFVKSKLQGALQASIKPVGLSQTLLFILIIGFGLFVSLVIIFLCEVSNQKRYKT